MNKAKKLGLVVLTIIVVLGIILFLVGYFRPKGAGILVQSQPPASVYVDDEQVGRTPYNGVFEPGEVVVKLVPETFDKPLAPYETVVNLVSGVETIVTRQFGEAEEDSSGEIVSFEEVAKDETSLAVLSAPDAAQVKINGIIRGFTPYKATDLSIGEHTLTVSAPGFHERSVDIQTFEGYMLTAVVKLAPTGEETEELVEGTEVVEKIAMVEILSTPTDFLRVRSEPSTLGEEVGRVTPGERFIILGEDEESGWINIEYEEGSEGWVTDQYVRKIDVDPEDVSDEEATTSAETGTDG